MKKQASRKPETDENPEWNEADFSRAVPFSALPASERAALSSVRRRGRQKAPLKVPVSIRLSPDVAEGLRATGAGWQSRADEVLRSWLRKAARS